MYYSTYKDLYYTPQNQSTVTTLKICLLVSDEGMFPLLTVFQNCDIDPLLL